MTIEDFWQAFLASGAAPRDARPYDVMRIGTQPSHADEGAHLILAGLKTTTSSLPSSFDATPNGPPFVGALSVLVDGSDRRLAVIETTEVDIRRLGDIDASFAYDYGEWDRTLPTWRQEIAAWYAADAAARGLPSGDDLVLLCERFRVLWRAPPPVTA